jgi:deoxyribonuclease-4
MKLGAHVSLGGKDKFLGSIQEALSYDANCLMVYTGAPQNTVRLPISDMKIQEAWALMDAHQLDKTDVYVHAPYIVNLANPNPDMFQFAVSFLTEELKRTALLGSHVMILHPGNHLGTGLDAGIRQIARGINQILDATKDLPTAIAIESMSGKGTEIGRSFEELQGIIRLGEQTSRIGVCLDSCHMHDAGYAIQSDFSGVLDEFDQIIGLDRIRVFHLNDSKNRQGVAKDRHANIGFGEIGFQALQTILTHPQLEGIAKILETPYVPDPIHPKKSYPPYRFEIAMMKSGHFQADLFEKIIQAEG